jgi:hypothetical protein
MTQEKWCSMCGATVEDATEEEPYCAYCKQWWVDNPPEESK